MRYTQMHQISVPMNRQQLELLDRTILGGAAPDRAALLRLALREHAARHPAPARAAAAVDAPAEDGQ